MFTLIKREIYDNFVFFVLAIGVSAFLVGASIVLAYQGFPKEEPNMMVVVLGVPSGVFLILGLCIMGASQMYTDKTREVSAFLSTLPVTRSRIMMARIITGVLIILILFLPSVLTIGLLLRLFALPVPILSGVVFEVFTVVFLMAFAIYCIGLQTGWNENKLMPTVGAMLLTCVFVPLVVIKGFGLEIVVLLVLFIAACLVRTWQKFMSTSL